MLKPSERLRAIIEMAIGPLQATTQAIIRHERIADYFGEYLKIGHGMIRASVPLMEQAVVACERRGPDDVAQVLAGYLRQHIPEELDHDKWLLEDLAVLSMSESTRDERPSAEIAALVGSQYYWIYHFHPLLLLGYIAVIEGMPPTKEGLDELRERTGLPRSCLSTAYKHAILDVVHARDLDDLLDQLPLDPGMTAELTKVALDTIDKLTDIYAQLLETMNSADGCAFLAESARTVP